jgi:LemA protein
MKKSNIKQYIFLGILALVFISGCSSFNSLSSKDEEINKQWQQVEVRYQARLDKTGNLLAIVEKAGAFEKGTLIEVMEARSAATQVKISVDELTPENIAKFQKAQNALGSSLGRLMAVAENYPQLQTIDAFRDFQAEYASMENTISRERNLFNEAVGDYNTSLRKFPRNLWARLFDFSKRAYFKSDEGSQKAPDIKNM